MKKINLKSILKKTFKTKKKVKKKVSKQKATKKLLKKNNKTKEKVQKKVAIKISKQKKSEEISNIKKDNLKIIKGADQKPEIKKIKIQQTEKKEYKINDYVVYPKHGVGKVREIKKINIGGIDVETYILNFEKDKASGMVPVNKQSHLRPLASINQ